MAGLRARNRADRNERILHAASRLFRTLGYESTRIELIAGEARVSVGTIYNYYQNKGDILVAIVSAQPVLNLSVEHTDYDDGPGSQTNRSQITGPHVRGR